MGSVCMNDWLDGIRCERGRSLDTRILSPTPAHSEVQQVISFHLPGTSGPNFRLYDIIDAHLKSRKIVNSRLESFDEPGIVIWEGGLASL